MKKANREGVSRRIRKAAGIVGGALLVYGQYSPALRFVVRVLEVVHLAEFMVHIRDSVVLRRILQLLTSTDFLIGFAVGGALVLGALIAIWRKEGKDVDRIDPASLGPDGPEPGGTNGKVLEFRIPDDEEQEPPAAI